MKSIKEPTVGIIMGSKSDWKGVMEHCSDTLKLFGFKHEVRVISAHRTPSRLHKFLKEAVTPAKCADIPAAAIIISIFFFSGCL